MLMFDAIRETLNARQRVLAETVLAPNSRGVEGAISDVFMNAPDREMLFPAA
jgi:hypothetical protein